MGGPTQSISNVSLVQPNGAARRRPMHEFFLKYFPTFTPKTAEDCLSFGKLAMEKYDYRRASGYLNSALKKEPGMEEAANCLDQPIQGFHFPLSLKECFNIAIPESNYYLGFKAFSKAISIDSTGSSGSTGANETGIIKLNQALKYAGAALAEDVQIMKPKEDSPQLKAAAFEYFSSAIALLSCGKLSHEQQLMLADSHLYRAKLAFTHHVPFQGRLHNNLSIAEEQENTDNAKADAKKAVKFYDCVIPHLEGTLLSRAEANRNRAIDLLKKCEDCTARQLAKEAKTGAPNKNSPSLGPERKLSRISGLIAGIRLLAAANHAAWKFRAAAKKDPLSAEAQFLLGDALSECCHAHFKVFKNFLFQGIFEEAIAAFERSCDPDSAGGSQVLHKAHYGKAKLIHDFREQLPAKHKDAWLRGASFCIGEVISALNSPERMAIADKINDGEVVLLIKSEKLRDGIESALNNEYVVPHANAPATEWH